MMKIAITGIGAWGPGFQNHEELMALLGKPGDPGPQPFEAPRPDCIPPRERRRAPLAVKLAVEVASQACVMAGQDPARAACVFTSGMGDMDITDYMCRTVASDDPLLSPTRFHNSVHNAPVGYWSISTGCTMSGNAVAAFEASVPASLLEAITQCQTEAQPVLWVTQDIRSPTPFKDLKDIGVPSAFALLLQPDGPPDGLHNLRFGSICLGAELAPGNAAWPQLKADSLRQLYESNPSARVLALLESMKTGPCALPLNPFLDLVLSPA